MNQPNIRQWRDAWFRSAGTATESGNKRIRVQDRQGRGQPNAHFIFRQGRDRCWVPEQRSQRLQRQATGVVRGQRNQGRLMCSMLIGCRRIERQDRLTEPVFHFFDPPIGVFQNGD